MLKTNVAWSECSHQLIGSVISPIFVNRLMDILSESPCSLVEAIIELRHTASISDIDWLTNKLRTRTNSFCLDTNIWEITQKGHTLMVKTTVACLITLFNEDMVTSILPKDSINNSMSWIVNPFWNDWFKELMVA